MNGIGTAWTVQDERTLQLAELLLNHEESMVTMLADAVERQGRTDLAELLAEARRSLAAHKADVKRQWCAWLRATRRAA